jgi:hypothetical protein
VRVSLLGEDQTLRAPPESLQRLAHCLVSVAGTLLSLAPVDQQQRRRQRFDAKPVTAGRAVRDR